MLNFIKHLFSSKSPLDKPQREITSDIDISSSSPAVRASVSNSYFDTMSKMQVAISKRDFQGAARCVRENLRQIPKWVKETRHDYGSFDIDSIPTLQQGGTILAIVGDDDGLAEMLQIVTSVPDLALWIEEVKDHQEDRHLFEAILEAVKTSPNCLQTDVKALVGVEDGHRIATLVSYLEKAGKIVRIKIGRTYKLVLPGSACAPSPSPKRSIESHRTGQKTTKAPRNRHFASYLCAIATVAHAMGGDASPSRSGEDS